MQAAVVPHVRHREAFVVRVVDAIDTARAAGMRVLYCRHMSLPNELSGVSQLRTSMTWQRLSSVAEVESRLLVGSPGYELIAEIAPAPSEAVFDKLAMSMFEGTPLELVPPGASHRRVRLGRRGGGQARAREPRVRKDVDADRRRHVCSHPGRVEPHINRAGCG